MYCTTKKIVTGKIDINTINKQRNTMKNKLVNYKFSYTTIHFQSNPVKESTRKLTCAN